MHDRNRAWNIGSKKLRRRLRPQFVRTDLAFRFLLCKLHLHYITANSLGQEARSGWSSRVVCGVIAGILTNAINCAILYLACTISACSWSFFIFFSSLLTCIRFVIRERQDANTPSVARGRNYSKSTS